jgi:hypothetical protein
MDQIITGGALIQSNLGSGNLEAVVFLRSSEPGQPDTLQHYWRDMGRPDRDGVKADRPVAPRYP